MLKKEKSLCEAQRQIPSGVLLQGYNQEVYSYEAKLIPESTKK